MESPEGLRLRRAEELFGAGRYDESEMAFRELFSSPTVAGQALAGLGLIAYVRGDIEGAEKSFALALDRGPNAHAYYGLGAIAEKRGRMGDAVQRYGEAVRLDPNHADSRKRLSNLLNRMNQPQPQPQPQPPRPEPVVPTPQLQQTYQQPQQTYQPRSEQYTQRPLARAKPADLPESRAGYWNILSADAAANSPTSVLSTQCLDAIMDLSLTKRPRGSAIFSMMISTLFSTVLVLGLIFFSAIVLRIGFGSFSPAHVVVAAFFFLVFWIVRCFWLRQLRYTIQGGWLLVKKGFISEETTYEMTFLRQADVKRGNLANLLTANGVLHLDFGQNRKAKLVGLAPMQELYVIRDKMLTLERLLRSHPLIKGVVG